MRLVMLGSGNVATHLARAAASAGIEVCQVISRGMDNARRLADEFPGCAAATDPAQAVPDADFYIIAATDSATEAIAARLPQTSGLIVHTSGSVPLDAMRRATANSAVGVLYPLQTFSRSAQVDVSQVPFFIEGADETTLAEVEKLGRLLSSRVYRADSETRGYLHVAGVLSNNFVNLLLSMTHDLLKQRNLPLDVVRPLLELTVDKAMSMDPRQAQTGPATRGDTATMERHESLLPDDDAEIYRLLSQAIINRSKANNQKH